VLTRTVKGKFEPTQESGSGFVLTGLNLLPPTETKESRTATIALPSRRRGLWQFQMPLKTAGGTPHHQREDCYKWIDLEKEAESPHFLVVGDQSHIALPERQPPKRANRLTRGKIT